MKSDVVGAVLEIPTSSGLAYALCTHYQRGYGALLRVFEKLYGTRPSDVPRIAEDGVRFSVFFPLEQAIKQRVFSIVGQVAIPDELQSFPVFRAGVIDPKTKKVATWWLWDGHTEWRVGQLKPEQRKLPIRGIWNDTMLVERIVSDWRPETDLR
ncbi:hypothetical protein [Pirellulimonas nuda]|uniref:hypothetical protein n=1 Tax=Pirellulimonas nuda TaxID=2528009 RepID=UPI00119DF0C6|nr:hypothetical protein [Pirellulimonas nuda]